MPESEVPSENNSHIGDSHNFDTCDIDLNNLPIAWRKDTRFCPSMYRYHIFQYVSSKQLSRPCHSFIAAIGFVIIISFVEEAFKCKIELKL